ncbi:MAG: FdtA/QdtA family cupin domain-containing protein [Cycloclasticus sp.]|jgi:WxcM-like, C-terminal.
MSLVKWIDLSLLGDDRGHLTVYEQNKNIPFEIKRIYYLTKTQKNVARGFHAHKELEQVAVCVSGSCTMILDNGLEKAELLLDSPVKAVRLEPMVWHEMHDFSENCVLLVLASDYYAESDYIRDYQEFVKAALQ